LLTRANDYKLSFTIINQKSMSNHPGTNIIPNIPTNINHCLKFPVLALDGGFHWLVEMYVYIQPRRSSSNMKVVCLSEEGSNIDEDDLMELLMTRLILLWTRIAVKVQL
jgi:hypothetical protein